MTLAIAAGASGQVRFVDIAEESGLDFSHVNGMAGELWLLEIMGSGVSS